MSISTLRVGGATVSFMMISGGTIIGSKCFLFELSKHTELISDDQKWRGRPLTFRLNLVSSVGKQVGNKYF